MIITKGKNVFALMHNINNSHLNNQHQFEKYGLFQYHSSWKQTQNIQAYHFCSKKPEEQGSTSNAKTNDNSLTKIISFYVLKKYFKQQQPKQERHRRRGKGNEKPKSHFNFGYLNKFLLALFGGGTIFYAQLQQALFTRLYDYLKRRINENEQINQGNEIQHRIEKQLQHQYEQYKENIELYHEQFSYRQQIQNLIHLRSNQSLLFIQSFSGNGLGNNLRRLINQRMHQRPKLFQKYYYLNLKDLPRSEVDSGNGGQKWYEATQLHFLIGGLIKSRKKSQKCNVLVIDEMQVLDHFFQNEQKLKTLKQLVRQIYQLQKIKNFKVICICNSKIFPFSLTTQLRNTSKLQLFKHIYINKMTHKDLFQVIATRTKYQSLITSKLKYKYKNDTKQIQPVTIQQSMRQFEEIIENILMNHDNLKQIFRILRSCGIDAKEYFQKMKKQFFHENNQLVIQRSNQKIFNYNPFFSEDYEYLISQNTKHQYFYRGHLPNIEFIQYKSQLISNRIIQEKVEFIKKQINIPIVPRRQSEIDRQGKNRELKIISQQIKAKYYILSRIYENGYQIIKQEQNDYNLAQKLKIDLENTYQYQAYLDLNQANIIQGFVFSDKSYYKAFENIKLAKDKNTKPKKYWLF